MNDRSDFRTRIAKALMRTRAGIGLHSYQLDDMADAVIREPDQYDENSGNPEKPLLERVVIAVLEALTDDDPFVLVAIGDHEIHVKWERTGND